MVTLAFGGGGHKWFEDYNSYAASNFTNSDFLAVDVPISHIFWTVEGGIATDHVDKNAYGCAFLFCPKGCEGSLKIYYAPGKCYVHKFKRGQVLAGRLTRSLHCPVAQAGRRNTFVMYADNRLVDISDNKNYLYIDQDRPNGRAIFE
jgi:hypothetical protein